MDLDSLIDMYKSSKEDVDFIPFDELARGFYEAAFSPLKFKELADAVIAWNIRGGFPRDLGFKAIASLVAMADSDVLDGSGEKYYEYMRRGGSGEVLRNTDGSTISALCAYINLTKEELIGQIDEDSNVHEP